MLVQLHRPNMKPFHYVLGVYVLALLQWEIDATQKIPVLGEEQANPKWETVQIPNTLMDPEHPEDGTWRAYAKGNPTWETQFANRKKIYKGREIALLFTDCYGDEHIADEIRNKMVLQAAAEFSRNNVRNGIVLAVFDGVIWEADKDPMTREILDKGGRNVYFDMENKIQIIDVADKDELERRHDQYKGAYIHTLYYDHDDVVRVGEDGKFQWKPLMEYMRVQHWTIGPKYKKMVLLKVRTSSVLKGDTEFFQKICEAKGEPKEYPVVYYEAYKRLYKIIYLREVDSTMEDAWDDCPFQ
ncbi:uncharacterized protein LOC128993581 isoform X2 [Macrosteles quadrilineatus]|uniref:uncharacterized protein LOC128993581 isoform X2 n=1 Tax=Macrosteles quadrilineatus TaxID=74068 RepID=UPI0023E2E173|nr:uncharacterized protein LOC128993581 isoform X2 [Macrosteles quadrilineatus]